MDGWGAAAIAIAVGRVGEVAAGGSWGRVEWVGGECWVGVDEGVGVGVGGVAGVNSQGRCAGDFLAESQHRLRERGSENPR